MVFLRAIAAVEASRAKARGEEKTGVDIVARALREPSCQIVENAGGEGEVVVEQILEKTGRYGYDAARGEFTDMFKAGIIDPAKVTRVALESAASVAGLMLTTDVLLTDLKDEEKQIANAIR